MKGDSGVSARGGSFLQVLLVKTVIQLHLMAWMWYNWYIIIFLLLWNRWTRIPMLMYIFYIVLCQYNRTLKRLIYPALLKKWIVWKWVANHWQGSLIKTADLDPTKNYIFSFHPHGIAAFSAWLTCATDGCDFSAKFPGIDLHALTLTTNLRLPFFREYLMLHGIMDASRQNCMNILHRCEGTSKRGHETRTDKGRGEQGKTEWAMVAYHGTQLVQESEVKGVGRRSGRGQSILLAVGGASESLVSRPKTYDLVLNKRKGFVRIALRTGASIVPCIAFGETNLYPTFEGEVSPFLKSVQRWVEKNWGFTLPLFYGELWPLGILVPFGLLAPSGRGPMPVVTGPPLECPKYEGDINSKGGRALVDEYHRKYVDTLLALWEKHKDEYAADRKSDMQLVQ